MIHQRWGQMTENIILMFETVQNFDCFVFLLKKFPKIAPARCPFFFTSTEDRQVTTLARWTGWFNVVHCSHDTVTRFESCRFNVSITPLLPKLQPPRPPQEHQQVSTRCVSCHLPIRRKSHRIVLVELHLSDHQ